MEYLHLHVLLSLLAAPKINKNDSHTPVYSFVGNRNPVTITCTFFGYPVPTVIMADKNGTETARGNSSASKTFVTTREGDFGMYNCSAQSPDGNAQYLVEFKKAGTFMVGKQFNLHRGVVAEIECSKFKTLVITLGCDLGQDLFSLHSYSINSEINNIRARSFGINPE